MGGIVAAAGVLIPAMTLVLAAEAPPDRILRAEMVLPAAIDQVWSLWTTEAGLTSFFAPGARIEPRVDGLFEIHFNPSAPPGSRGADGMRIIVFEPPERLAFTWNAPMDQASVRAQRTIVYLDFEDAGNGMTRFRFTHSGWGSGPDWDKAYDYFNNAWNGFVLPMLKLRVERGPVNWQSPPEVRPLVPTLKTTLR